MTKLRIRAAVMAVIMLVGVFGTCGVVFGAVEDYVHTEGSFTYSISYSKYEATLKKCDTALSGKVVIPEKVTATDEFGDKMDYFVLGVSDGSFAGCNNITSIELPKWMKYNVTPAIFDDCPNLKEISIYENEHFGKVTYTVFFIRDNVLYNDKGSLIRCPEGTEGEVHAAVGTRTVLGGAFKDCNKIKKVTLGKDVITVGKNAFSGCSSLEEIIVYDKKTAIDKNAFGDGGAPENLRIYAPAESLAEAYATEQNCAFVAITEETKLTASTVFSSGNTTSKVITSISNKGQSVAENVNVIVAGYDAKGSMLKCIKQKMIDVDAESTYTISMGFPNEFGAELFKTFIIESDTALPLVAAKEASVALPYAMSDIRSGKGEHLYGKILPQENLADTESYEGNDFPLKSPGKIFIKIVDNVGNNSYTVGETYEFSIGDSDAVRYIGRGVEFYTEKILGVDTIVSLAPTYYYEDVYSIPLGDLEPFESWPYEDGETLYGIDVEYKLDRDTSRGNDRFTVEGDSTVLLNGAIYTDGPLELFKSLSKNYYFADYAGGITVCNIDGKRHNEFLIVNICSTAVVDEFYEDELYFMSSVVNPFSDGYIDSINLSEVSYVLTDISGNKIEPTDLNSYDVLSICMREDGKYFDITRLEAYTDKVIAFDGLYGEHENGRDLESYKLQSDGKYHNEVSDAFGANGLGRNYIADFYLDRYGNIAAYRNVIYPIVTIQGKFLASVVVQDDLNGDSITVKISTDSGTQTAYLAPNVKIKNIDAAVEQAWNGYKTSKGVYFIDEAPRNLLKMLADALVGCEAEIAANGDIVEIVIQ